LKTLIVYASTHGCSADAADFLKDRIQNSTVIDLKKTKKIEITSFDTIIIGGSIHAGSVQKIIKKLQKNNLELLLQKRLGLFLCCMETGETAKDQFNKAFLEPLRNNATAIGLFGGRFDFNKMNFFEKAIIKKIAGITSSISRIDENAMESFLKDILKR